MDIGTWQWVIVCIYLSAGGDYNHDDMERREKDSVKFKEILSRLRTRQGIL